MATSVQKTPYQKWQETVDQGKADKRWAEHDKLIEATVNDFNQRLAKLGAGYKPLDKRLVKAMVWVESGGPDNAAWKTRPMQIGNPGDPGLAALLGGKEGGDLVLAAEHKRQLAAGANTAAGNILAGVAYLLMRAGTYKHQSVAHATDTKVYEVTVKAGDSLDKIAKAHGSTVDMLTSLNPGARGMIKPGQVLKLRKASIQQVVASWATVDAAFAARKYNVGDPQYKQKLEYCLSIMPK